MWTCGSDMALTDAAIKARKPQMKRYLVTDDRGHGGCCGSGSGDDEATECKRRSARYLLQTPVLLFKKRGLLLKIQKAAI